MRYVDVNVLFYWLTNHEELGDTATTIIRRIENGEKAVTSTLTLWLLHILLERTTENYDPNVLVDRLRKIKFLRIVPLNQKHFEKAIILSQEYGLDLEDAIHLAVALENRCQIIYSNDKDFDRTPLKRKFE